MAARLEQQESLKQPSLSLKIGDTVLFYYKAAERDRQRSGYVLSDFSRYIKSYVQA